MNERKWIDIEPAESSLSAYEVSKKVVNLLRHCQTIQREDGGVVQFWRINFYLRNQFPQNHYWSDDRWKACLAAGGGSNRRYQYCSDISGTIVNSELFKDTQDVVSSETTTRATCTSPSTTPMTMLTSTIAWCTPCVERARRAHSFTRLTPHWLKS